MVSLSFENVAIVLFVCWAVWFNKVANTSWINVGPVKTHKLKHHPSKPAYGGPEGTAERLYIITGGSGFRGSWIARYLLARGEAHVYIVDRQRPPKDLVRHGATFIEADLTNFTVIEREFNKLNDLVQSSTQIIVYNCAIVKRIDFPNFQADLGVNAAEMLLVSLRHFSQGAITLIHIGDSLAHRMPVRNWDRVWPTADVWCQTSSSDLDVGFGPGAQSKEDRRDRSFSSYAWHQLQIETMFLQAGVNNPAIVASAVLRVEGYASGHVGDGFLSPILRSGTAFIHSPNAPISIVNVEDVARGCLSLEHQLLDPETRDGVNFRLHTVGSKEVTTLKRVFEYCKLQKPTMRVITIPPVIIFVLTWLLSCVFMGKPRPSRKQHDSFLKLPITSLTFARFYTLQVGQIPNAQNEKRQHDVLALHNNFTLSATLDSLLKETEITESTAKTQ